MTDASGTLVVVRHGETEWNKHRRFQGWGHVGLNERGRTQARAVGRHLASAYDFDRVLASDLRRTRETTAEVRQAGVAPEPRFEKAWRERGLGRYQGLTYDELHDRHPEFDPENGFIGIHSRPEGGESLLDLHRRVSGRWQQLVEELGDETVLVVTHGGPLHVIHGLLAGEDLLTAFRNYSHANCGYSRFRVTGSRVSVEGANETGWREAD